MKKALLLHALIETHGDRKDELLQTVNLASYADRDIKTHGRVAEISELLLLHELIEKNGDEEDRLPESPLFHTLTKTTGHPHGRDA